MRDISLYETFRDETNAEHAFPRYIVSALDILIRNGGEIGQRTYVPSRARNGSRKAKEALVNTALNLKPVKLLFEQR